MMDKSLIKDLYNKFALEYHAKRNSFKESFYNTFIELPAISALVKEVVRNKKVLDLGCGTGIFTKKIHEWEGKVIGIDFSEAMINIAKDESPLIEFYILDAERTNFPDNEFDIVTNSLMIHYFDDLNNLFREINRILKQNGLFIFSFHHPFNEVIEKIDINDRIENILNDYFNEKEYSWKMLEGMNLISYHHTFETVSKSLYNNGFLIQIIKEPRPIEEGKKIDENRFYYLDHTPTFCIIKAIKI
jgi:ubiquinone/menaquinone biosynthesis C-methylase UbiE